MCVVVLWTIICCIQLSSSYRFVDHHVLCRYLQFAHQQLQSAQSLIQQKVARHEKELEERKFGPKKERELLLKQLEADKTSRKDK